MSEFENEVALFMQEMRADMKELRGDVSVVHREIGELREEVRSTRLENIRSTRIAISTFEKLRSIDRKIAEVQDDLEVCLKGEVLGQAGLLRRELDKRIDDIESSLSL